MRIEISAGGIGNGISVLDFQSDLKGYLSDVDNIISSFKTIKSCTCELNGGAGELQGALDDIEARIRKEDSTRQEALEIQSKASSFIALAERVDKQVAVHVDKNKDELYKTNGWQKPSPANEETAWYEDAWSWLCGVGEAAVEGIKEVWSWIKDSVGKAWAWAVDFYEENKNLCRIIIGTLAISVAVIVTVASGGAALPALLAMTKAAITAGLVSAAIGGMVSAGLSLISGNSIESSLKAAFDSAIDGFCSGFMWGGIFAACSQIISVSSAKPMASRNNQIKANREQGRLYEEKQYSKFSKKYNNAEQQITIETPSGRKTRVDEIGLDSKGNVIINELKSSPTAPLTKNQATAFPEILQSGGVVKGAGKGIFTEGFSIPPGTEVKIVRSSFRYIDYTQLMKWPTVFGGAFGSWSSIGSNS